MIAAFGALSISFTYGLYEAQRSREQACVQINDLSTALRTIIDRGDRNTRRLAGDGAFTSAQLRDSLKFSAEARRLLGPIDCR